MQLSRGLWGPHVFGEVGMQRGETEPVHGGRLRKLQNDSTHSLSPDMWQGQVLQISAQQTNHVALRVQKRHQNRTNTRSGMWYGSSILEAGM